MTDIARETFVAQRGLPEDEFFCDAFTLLRGPEEIIGVRLQLKLILECTCEQCAIST